MSITTRAPSRLLVLLVVIAAFSLLLLVSAVQATDRVGEPEARSTAQHEVQQGETLWEIATAIGLPGDDVRATVYEIKRINGLRGATIQPGQVLTVPAGG